VALVGSTRARLLSRPRNWLARAVFVLAHWKSKLRDLPHHARDGFLLIRLNLSIYRHRLKFERASLPFSAIRPLHNFDNPLELEKTHTRARMLVEHREELTRTGIVSTEVLAKYAPSITPIRVIELGQGVYVSYEGNGRLAALRTALHPDEQLAIEVEVAIVKRPEIVLSKIRHYWTRHGLA
jgi:hypothetical protein